MIIKDDQKPIPDFFTGARAAVGFIKANYPFLLLLIALCVLVYFNSLDGEFISGDDTHGYVNNTAVRDLSASFKSLQLQTIIYAVMYALFQVNPVPLHVLSLLLHILITCLVFFSTSMLFGKRVGRIASLLFAVHPANTEAIVWISGLPYMFNAFFFYLILLFYLNYRKSNKLIFLGIAIFVGLVTVAVYRSAWGLAIPMLVLVIDSFLIETRFRLKTAIRPLIAATPFLIYAAIFLGDMFSTRVHSLRSDYGLDPETTTPWLNRIPYTFFMQLKLFIFPKGLTLYHEGELITSALYNFMVIATVVFVGAIIYFWTRKSSPKEESATPSFVDTKGLEDKNPLDCLSNINRKVAGLLLLLPVSIAPAFSPIQVSWFIADRYLYLGSAFFCVLVALLFYKLEKLINIKHLATILAVLLIIAYSARTISRNNDWSSSKSLALADISVSVNSHRVYNNLGDAYAREGNLEEALKAFERATQLKPDYPDAKHNLGNIYLQMGRTEEAEEQFKLVVSLKPQMYQAQFNLAYITYQKGDYAASREYLQQVMKLNPDYANAREMLMTIESMGDPLPSSDTSPVSPQ